MKAETVTTYTCEKCGLKSRDHAEVEACEAIPMQPTDIKPGDKVIIGRIGGSGYGWWEGSAEWFLADPASADNPPSQDHHRRHTIGHPVYAVLDVIPYGETDSVLRGSYGHQYVAILYSPDHANRGKDRIAYFWTPARNLTKVGDASRIELETFKAAAAKLGRPDYGNY